MTKWDCNEFCLCYQPQELAGIGAGEGNRTLVISLEGYVKVQQNQR